MGFWNEPRRTWAESWFEAIREALPYVAGMLMAHFYGRPDQWLITFCATTGMFMAYNNYANTERILRRLDNLRQENERMKSEITELRLSKNITCGLRRPS